MAVIGSEEDVLYSVVPLHVRYGSNVCVSQYGSYASIRLHTLIGLTCSNLYGFL